jgi:hypothetical protein
VSRVNRRMATRMATRIVRWGVRYPPHAAGLPPFAWGCLFICIGLCLGSLVMCATLICVERWHDVPSPDGEYIAVAAETYCDLGATGSSGGTVVKLRGRQNWLGKAEEVRLLSVPRMYRWQGRLRWETPRTLWVEYRHPPVQAPDTWKDVQIRYCDITEESQHACPTTALGERLMQTDPAPTDPAPTGLAPIPFTLAPGGVGLPQRAAWWDEAALRARLV